MISSYLELSSVVAPDMSDGGGMFPDEGAMQFFIMIKM